MTTHTEPISPAADRAVGDRYLLFLALVLGGYALFSKGWAYLGISPLFIGEIALLTGVAVALMMRHWHRLFEIKPFYALVPLVLWGLLQTFPYISPYGVDALRDATVFGYSAFGVIVALLLVSDPTRLAIMLGWYRKYWRVFLLSIPVIFIIFRFFHSAMPLYSWAPGVTPIYVKEGDVMVHLAAILGFWVAGFERDVKWGWFLLMAFCVATLGLVDRAGMLAFFAVGTLCLIIKPRHEAAWRLVMLACLAVMTLWLSGVRIEIPGGKGRDISFRQLVVNAGSLFGKDSGDAGMDSNKDWRLNWWTDVVDYTFHGKYFWRGKGFGVNLADDDGYQLFQDSRLRSPHSAHVTFLARAGVPGLVLWMLVWMSWGYAILRNYIRARKEQDAEWESVFGFIGVFGVALLVNSSFDVYLEGPMGGIWFWCVYGLGLGALWIYQNCPQVLTDPEFAGDEAGDDVALRLSSARPR
jgi:hypothetical protein